MINPCQTLEVALRLTMRAGKTPPPAIINTRLYTFILSRSPGAVANRLFLLAVPRQSAKSSG